MSFSSTFANTTKAIRLCDIINVKAEIKIKVDTQESEVTCQGEVAVIIQNDGYLDISKDSVGLLKKTKIDLSGRITQQFVTVENEVRPSNEHLFKKNYEDRLKTRKYYLSQKGTIHRLSLFYEKGLMSDSDTFQNIKHNYNQVDELVLFSYSYSSTQHKRKRIFSFSSEFGNSRTIFETAKYFGIQRIDPAPSHYFSGISAVYAQKYLSLHLFEKRNKKLLRIVKSTKASETDNISQIGISEHQGQLFIQVNKKKHLLVGEQLIALPLLDLQYQGEKQEQTDQAHSLIIQYASTAPSLILSMVNGVFHSEKYSITVRPSGISITTGRSLPLTLQNIFTPKEKNEIIEAKSSTYKNGVVKFQLKTRDNSKRIGYTDNLQVEIFKLEEVLNFSK